MTPIRPRPLLLVGFLATMLCGLASHAAPPSRDPADSQVMIVTSDSSAYCRTLSGTIEALSPLPREVRELKEEGDGLCNEGQVRGGITRLRRALLVLRKGQQARSPDEP